MIVVLSPHGDILQQLSMYPHHIDDMVFDSNGGFYCSDLSGTFDHPDAGIFYVENDLSTVHPIIEKGLIKSNGIVLSRDGKTLYFTEFGAGKFDCIRLGYDSFSLNQHKPYTPYYFTGLEGPDSMTIDEDGNLYVAMTGQGRFLVFNAKAMPVGEILIPGREQGKMLKSTHIAIQPDTCEAYMCTADMQSGEAALYKAGVYAKAVMSFQFM